MGWYQLNFPLVHVPVALAVHCNMCMAVHLSLDWQPVPETYRFGLKREPKSSVFQICYNRHCSTSVERIRASSSSYCVEFRETEKRVGRRAVWGGKHHSHHFVTIVTPGGHLGCRPATMQAHL